MYKQFVLDNIGHAHHRALKEFYRQLIGDTLKLTRGNKTHAAKLLGITREKLRKWMHVAGIYE